MRAQDTFQAEAPEPEAAVAAFFSAIAMISIKAVCCSIPSEVVDAWYKEEFFIWKSV